MDAVAATNHTDTRKRNWRVFVAGLGIRLLGLLFIWLGDGSDNWFRRAVVVVGVILTIGGIAVLRYMLFAPLLSKLSKRR